MQEKELARSGEVARFVVIASKGMLEVKARSFDIANVDAKGSAI